LSVQPLVNRLPSYRNGTINGRIAGQDKPQFLERTFFWNVSLVEEIDDGLVVNNVGC